MIILLYFLIYFLLNVLIVFFRNMSMFSAILAAKMFSFLLNFNISLFITKNKFCNVYMSSHIAFIIQNKNKKNENRIKRKRSKHINTINCR